MLSSEPNTYIRLFAVHKNGEEVKWKKFHRENITHVLI